MIFMNIKKKLIKFLGGGGNVVSCCILVKNKIQEKIKETLKNIFSL